MNSKLLTLSFLLFVGLVISTSSCKKDNAVTCGSFGWAFAVVDEAAAYSNAYSEWQADPENTAKCEAYIAAYEDYLNALRDYEKCVESSERDDWQQSIDAAIEDINNTDCE